MSKFILEFNTDGNYVMSYLNDFLSTSTYPCKSIDESFNEMISQLKKLVKNKNEEMKESFIELRDLCSGKKLAIDFFGIDLMNADEMRRNFTEKFKEIAVECLSHY